MSVLLKQYNKSLVILLELAFTAVVLVMIIDDASDSVSDLIDIFSLTEPVREIYKALFKGALICIISTLAGDMAKESGNILIGDVIELGGRIMLLVISIPFIESVIKTAISFAK